MTIDELLDSLPEYAKDLKLNYSSLVRGNTELSTSQLWGTVLASAIATRSPLLTAALTASATAQLTPQVLYGAHAAAAVMGMNNVFYRFQHLSSNAKYASMPARLRMNVMRTHGVDEADFELWSLAVSAINACGKCIDAHEQVLREKGVGEEIILATVRVASMVHGIGVVLDSIAATQSNAV
jgi:alkyl hydroperoxide reductase subunit D